MRLCTIDGCENRYHARGWCIKHWHRWNTHGDPLYTRPTTCTVGTCDRPHRGRGLCNMHLLRLQRFGDPLYERPQPQPWIDSRGYRMLYMPAHPNAYPNGRVLEHVVVMSELLGRPLHKGESIHHRNGVRADNRPENLELWASRHPSGQRVSDLVSFARNILTDYGHLDDTD